MWGAGLSEAAGGQQRGFFLFDCGVDSKPLTVARRPARIDHSGPSMGSDLKRLRSGDDSDDDDDVPMTAQERQHIDRMLQGYVADEEDAGLVALLQQEFSGSSSSSSSSNDLKRQQLAVTDDVANADDLEDTDDGDGDDEIGGNNSGGQASMQQQQHNNSKNRSSSDGHSGGESKFARSDRRSRVESHFQRVVAAAPAQVVRYQYGGDPLWCTFPSPTDHHHPQQTSVPHCEHCGARREFECQLMPGIFALKPLFAHQPRPPQTPTAYESSSSSSSSSSTMTCALNSEEQQTKTTATTEAVGQQSLMGETFDFGVVAVYSCPNSCSSSDSSDNNNIDSSSNSRKTTRLRFEFAVVQPPI